LPFLTLTEDIQCKRIHLNMLSLVNEIDGEKNINLNQYSESENLELIFNEEGVFVKSLVHSILLNFLSVT